MRKGFSLIELMVVIVIVGLLAAIAVPTYQTYSQRSKMAAFYEFAKFAQDKWVMAQSSLGGASLINTQTVFNKCPAYDVLYQTTGIRMNVCNTYHFPNEGLAGLSVPAAVVYTANQTNPGVYTWTCDFDPAGNNIGYAGGTLSNEAIRARYFPNCTCEGSPTCT